MMRPIDADRLNMRFADEQLANRGWRDDYCEILDCIMEVVDEQPTIDDVVSCDGCRWKEIGRQQKCSCCRRNRHMKDNYERRAVK